jgi:signal peptide peptidase SppA
MSDISGGTSVDGFMKQFRQCLNDPGVSGIVLDVDSPGGNVSGVPEAAAEIMAARGTKPIVAVADPMIASAAYYLACAADEIVCMPSGEVGSIGVLAIHDDYSVQNEMIGYKPTYIFFGAYKTELNSDSPLDPDALAYQQKQIDAIGNDFVRFAAKARGVPVDSVRSDFGQGRMLLAKDALAVKMIDRIDTLDATIVRVGRMGRTPAPGASALAGAAADRTRLGAALIGRLPMFTGPTGSIGDITCVSADGERPRLEGTWPERAAFSVALMDADESDALVRATDELCIEGDDIRLKLSNASATYHAIGYLGNGDIIADRRDWTIEGTAPTPPPSGAAAADLDQLDLSIGMRSRGL